MWFGLAWGAGLFKLCVVLEITNLLSPDGDIISGGKKRLFFGAKYLVFVSVFDGDNLIHFFWEILQFFV